jgi:hypothetical protein
MHLLLSQLAYRSIEDKGTNSGLTTNYIQEIFAQCNIKYGCGIDAIRYLRISIDLGILEKFDELYCFSHQQYQDYYYNEGLDRITITSF